MRQVGAIGLVVACLAVVGPAKAGAATTLRIDDFDRGEKPNAQGGNFGSWDKDPNDPTQKCTIAFDKEHALGGTGYSLRLDYDVDSPNAAYNGFWTKLQGINVQGYKQLSLYVKGDPRSYTTQIKLELKNNKNEVGHYLLKGITDQWQKFSISLKDIAGITDWTSMAELVVVFDDMTSTKKVGTIYLDEILFEGGEGSSEAMPERSGF